MAGTQGGAALARQAATLRADLVGRFRTEQSRIVSELDGARAAKAAADAVAVEAQAHVRQRSQEAATVRRQVVEAQREADALDAKGLTVEAAEVREQLQGQLARAGTAHDLVVAAERRVATAKADSAAQAERVLALRKERDDLGPVIQAAERQLDVLDDKATYLQESGVHAANAVRLHAEADRLRAEGRTAEADRLVAQSVDEDIAAQAKQGSADELVVDPAPLRAAGLDAPDLAAADPSTDLGGGPVAGSDAPLTGDGALAFADSTAVAAEPDPLVASLDADPMGAEPDEVGSAFAPLDDLTHAGALDGPPDLDDLTA